MLAKIEGGGLDIFLSLETWRAGQFQSKQHYLVYVPISGQDYQDCGVNVKIIIFVHFWKFSAKNAFFLKKLMLWSFSG
jgi:hypothetical protein